MWKPGLLSKSFLHTGKMHMNEIFPGKKRWKGCECYMCYKTLIGNNFPCIDIPLRTNKPFMATLLSASVRFEGWECNHKSVWFPSFSILNLRFKDKAAEMELNIAFLSKKLLLTFLLNLIVVFRDLIQKTFLQDQKVIFLSNNICT